MNGAARVWVLRAALWLGAVIDGFVGIVALFFQPLMGPLFDIPARDAALATLGGGELIVVAALYVAVLCDVRRFRPLLWILALDQTLAIVLPSWAIARGDVAATWKIVGPYPVSAALVAVFVFNARDGRRR